MCILRERGERKEEERELSILGMEDNFYYHLSCSSPINTLH